MANLSLSDVQKYTAQVQPRIIESAAFYNQQTLTRCGFKVISGVEFKDYQYGIARKGATTRPYKAGATVSNSAGKVTERVLTVKLAMNRFVDNIQAYREKEPFHVDAENKWVAPNTDLKIRAICADFADDVRIPALFGKYDENGGNSVLSCYDGLLKQLTTNKASVKCIDTDAFAAVTDSTKSANWEILVDFVTKLPAPLKRAARNENEGVYILMSHASKALLLDSYGRTFPALTPESINDVDTKFLGLGNYHVIGTDLIGEGSLMLATTKDNLVFGVDSENNKNNVEVDRDNNDFNNIIFQIQSAQGIGCEDWGKVAVNDCANTFSVGDYVGDYVDASDNIAVRWDYADGWFKMDAQITATAYNALSTALKALYQVNASDNTKYDLK